MLRTLILAVTLAIACFGQRFEIGARAGVPVTSSFATGSLFTIGFGEGASSATRRCTVGPMVGVQLAHGFGLEFDALYRRLGFDDLIKSPSFIFTHTRTTAGSWDFPILGKFRYHRFYADGGLSFRHVSGVSTAVEQYLFFYPNQLTQTTGTTSAILDARSTHGGVVGLGVETRLAFLRFSPEVRYTRWGADRNLDRYLHSNQNQVDILLGITF